jgi:acyl-coenzyme A synthetase/AMP-(fatty) acid ligase
MYLHRVYIIKGRTSVPVKSGSSSFAIPGYEVVCLDSESGLEVESNQLGQLAIRLPMPPGTLPFLYKVPAYKYTYTQIHHRTHIYVHFKVGFNWKISPRPNININNEMQTCNLLLHICIVCC